jgi:hypothetical protein
VQRVASRVAPVPVLLVVHWPAQYRYQRASRAIAAGRAT